MSPPLHRPAPVSVDGVEPVDQRTTARKAAARLLDGQRLIVADGYATGVGILAQLHRALDPPADDAPYASRRAFRRAYRDAAERLLAPVSGHRLALERAPSIGFLKLLYPDVQDFALPFLDVQHLNRAWNLYNQGVHLAVLGYAVHPFFGTYAPNRVEHLELFATWLAAWEGPRHRAVDVGTGCGVLALLLAKAGFDEVVATDLNPNAVESLRRDLGRRPTPPPVEPRVADLLTDVRGRFDLVVFNPPWTRGEIDDPLEQALHFEDGLFERFFDQAVQALTPQGRVVLVFSNLIRLVQPDVPHPIEAELERGRFVHVGTRQRKVKATPTASGKRRATREKVEVWELALAPAG